MVNYLFYIISILLYITKRLRDLTVGHSDHKLKVFILTISPCSWNKGLTYYQLVKPKQHNFPIMFEWNIKQINLNHQT